MGFESRFLLNKFKTYTTSIKLSRYSQNILWTHLSSVGTLFCDRHFYAKTNSFESRRVDNDL